MAAVVSAISAFRLPVSIGLSGVLDFAERGSVLTSDSDGTATGAEATRDTAAKATGMAGIAGAWITTAAGCLLVGASWRPNE